MDADPTLHARLLGPFSLARGGQALSLPATEMARSLLAYLLFHRNRPQARPLLAGVFWPDLPESQARRALTQSLYQIRRALPELIQADIYCLSLSTSSPIWVDAHAFQGLLHPDASAYRDSPTAPEHPTSAEGAMRSLQEAVGLYRGDLLAGFYDDWVLLARENLRGMYLQALGELVELGKTLGRYSEALDYAQRLAQADPLDEAAQRELMRLLFALGRPQEALEGYQAFRKLLETELAVEPEAETSALAQKIAGRLAGGALAAERAYLPEVSLPPSPSTGEALISAQLPLVGRAAERKQLLSHLEAALVGLGGFLLVEGEAGVGKTRLAGELARDAEWRGAQALFGRGQEGATWQPYHLLASALESGLSPLRVEQLKQLVEPAWLKALRPLLPGLAEALAGAGELVALPAEQERQRLVSALAQVLRAWGQVKPLVLILEDLHWADADTLDVLSRLAEMLGGARLLVMCTFRGEEARADPLLWSKLEAIGGSSAFPPLRLTRLDTGAASELIRRALGLGAPAALFEARLYQETGGNPLFILETLRALYEEGLLVRDAGGAWSTAWDLTTQDYAELPLPAAVEISISRRLKLAPIEMRGLLELAAAIGAQFESKLLQAASGIQPASLLPSLDALVRRQILEETPNAYRFAHDKIREVVYRELDGETRSQLHRRIAQALAALAPEQVAALAFHAARGELWSQAVVYNQKAAEMARTMHASQAAWEHCTQALELLLEHSPFSAERAAELEFELRSVRCDLAWVLGNVTRQESELAALLELAQKSRQPEKQAQVLLMQADFQCNAQDEYATARQTAGAALRLAQDQGLPQLAARAMQIIGAAWHRSDHYAEAERALLGSIEIWQSLPEMSLQLAETCTHLSQLYEHSGNIPRSEAQARRAAEIAGQADAPLPLARAYAALARLAYRRDDVQAAIHYNQQALELARRVGHKHNEAVLLCNLGFDYWAFGDYQKVIDYTLQGLEIYRLMGNRRGAALGCDNLSALYTEIGQHEKAGAEIEAGLELARQIRFQHVEANLLSNQGRMRLELGEAGGALQAYQGALDVAVSIQAPNPAGAAHLGLGMTYAASGQYALAAQHLEQAIESYAAAGESAFVVAARSYLALARLALGDLEQALRLSNQAVSDLEAASGGEHVQDTYLHHYHILSACGQKEAALAALDRARQEIERRAASLPPEWRPAFLENVAVNREVLELCSQHAPCSVRVRLARAAAPTGRPLREDELVEISWTVNAPQDLAIADPGAQRRQRILRMVAEASSQGAAPTVDDLARALGASPATIKRDLAALRQAGRELPTRGGRGGKSPSS
ncbi:MAG: AAA family ATPase [Anaerolineales bacterium]|nr:AAA family ATPase [Anaerolineales bacterium]